MMILRGIEPRIRAALADTPVVLITGARQTGKSTLAQHLVGADGTYRTLDSTTTRAAALADPDAFLAAPGTLVIDEVQRVPDLLLAIKAAVDRDRAPGRFILTGSADVMHLPSVTETLAGRIEQHRLHPFSLAELRGDRTSFIDLLEQGSRPDRTDPLDRDELVDILLTGGYPAVQGRAPDRRSAWYDEYIDAIVLREVPSVAEIHFAEMLPRLLRLLAAASPGALTVSSLTTALQAPRTTVDRYVAIVRNVFLVHLLQPWHANIGTRQVKSMRSIVADSGLQAELLDLTADRLSDWHPDKVGPLLETFVGNELLAQAGWAAQRTRINWWRTSRGAEVDFVVEHRSGVVDGIEVKAATTVTHRDTRGLTTLRDALGDRFGRGIVLYTGTEVQHLGERIEAWPVSSLWASSAP